MPVATQDTDGDGLPDVESREWGKYGVVLVDTGNSSGWILDRGGDLTVDCDDWR